MNSIVYSYNEQDFKAIVNESTSYADCMRKLGYQSISGDSVKVLKRRIEELGISIAHFIQKEKVIRTEDNVFCINSTADQSTLRKFYKNKRPQEKCDICGQNLIWNNKPLVLILDHINGNNTDNRIENLRWVCGNCNSQLETTNARNSHQQKYFCKNCGKQVSNKNTIYCQECFIKFQEHPYKGNWPDRETLKTLIRTVSFEEIGRKVGVRGNSVRKHCKKLLLPSTKKEIESYSDEEWDKI